MTLIVDRRAEVDGPGFHALVAGVSHYLHLPDGRGRPAAHDLGMCQLSSASLSAFRIASWLERRADSLCVPLATLRLLVSPASSEVEAVPDLESAAERCTFDSLRRSIGEWRDDAATRADDVTLFYFAGHGVQRSKGDAVLLCEDFGDGLGGLLDKTIASISLYNGMAPSPAFPDIARTQFYFIDACREQRDEFAAYEQMATGNLWDVELGGRDDRVAPIFFSAVPGSRAYARPGKETLFTSALLAGLDGDAADMQEVDDENQWYVSYQKLVPTIAERLRRDLKGKNIDQQFRSDGFGADAVIHHLDGPPEVRVSLEVQPSAALAHTRVEIVDDGGKCVTRLPVPLVPHPYTCRVPAGIYTINACIEPPHQSYVDRPGKARPIMPPRYRWSRSVTR